jgi:DNA-binding response OmpR family regulator
MLSTGNARSQTPGLAKTMTRARVLIVEDNTAFRALMADVLALEGCKVTEAFDATSMRWHMRVRGLEEYPDEPFDLIITDIQMPGESGLISLEWLRLRGCPIPVVVVTSFPELTTQAQVNRLSATLLPKPFSLNDFRAAALAALRAHGRNTRGGSAKLTFR